MKEMKILILLTCIPILCFGQLSPKVNKLYQQLSQSKRAESKNISIDGHESDLYKVGENIGDAASNKELEYIAYNGHHVPKYYAMINLFKQKSKSLEKLFRHYRKSNDSVSILKGCVGGFSRLDEEMYLNIFFEKQVIKQTEWEKMERQYDH